jgi:putative acetyltransferase
MIRIIRTNIENEDFKVLVKELDSELINRNPLTQHQYDKLNILPKNVFVVLGYDDDELFGCGCLKRNDDENAMEVKRMYIKSKYRGRGLSRIILNELQKWAIDEGNIKLILETGKNQFEAIGLYKSFGFIKIPNYGHYNGNENSICMEKNIDVV